MAEEVSITITGVKEVQEGLKRIEENLIKTDEPLSKSGRFMQLEAFANFPAQGKTFGESWPPYAKAGWKFYVDKKGGVHPYWFPGTEAIKAEKGFAGRPLMVRTGRLFGSFQVNRGTNFVEVFNPVPYAIYHQEGRGIINLPRRVLLKFAQRQVNEITKIFVNWIVEAIRKSFE